MTFESESFVNGELLVDALKDTGFENVTRGKDLLLQGWDKRDARRADILVRRADVKNHRLLSDIGFQRTANGYVAVIDDMDLNYSLGKDFVKRLQSRYHESVAKKMAKKLGGTLIKELIGKTVKIRVKF